MAIVQKIVDRFRGNFADVNRRLCEKMCNVPATPETNFDLTLIEAPGELCWAPKA